MIGRRINLTFEDNAGIEIPILESGEPMLKMVEQRAVRLMPQYHLLGFETADPDIYLRAGLIARLTEAASKLPTGLALVVWDGFRTLETQREIYDRCLAKSSVQIMALAEREEFMNKFVSPLPASKSQYRQNPPPHTTGGAVDVSLCDDHGNGLDMGAGFDQFDESAQLDHFERKNSPINDFDARCRWNRRQLFDVMVTSGFAPYPAEYWHYEFGTKRAAAFNHLPNALYGGIAPC